MQKEAYLDDRRWHHRDYDYDISEEIMQFRGFLIERKDFLKWLWTSDEANLVCVELTKNEIGLDRFRTELVYETKTKGVQLPKIERKYNNSPYARYYITGTKIEIPADTIFYGNASVTRLIFYPNWFQVQRRRIMKKLNKRI